MMRIVYIIVIAVALSVHAEEATECHVHEASLLQFTVNDIDGKEVALSNYKGKVLLVVNVASKCGLTPQYAKLAELYTTYKARGFEILAFPANNFNNQEPGTDKEIKAFCTTRYDVSFPLFSKISVTGDEIAPLYAFLVSEDSNPEFGGPIEWNFAKFLIDREGNVVARFGPSMAPDSPQIKQALEKALGQAACCPGH